MLVLGYWVLGNLGIGYLGIRYWVILSAEELGMLEIPKPVAKRMDLYGDFHLCYLVSFGGAIFLFLFSNPGSCF